MNSQINRNNLLKTVCGVGIFSALAYTTTLICKLIPTVGGFLSLELKDAVIAIASFIYGPAVAPILALITSALELVTISTTGPWGFLMNFASSSVFSLTASLIYKFFKRNFNGAIVGFSVATVLTTLVMIGLNPLIVPLYSGVSKELVIDMIPTLLLPFNFAKTLINSASAMLLYKPVIGAMRKAKLVAPTEYKTTFNKSSVITLIVGGVSLIIGILIMFVFI